MLFFFLVFVKQSPNVTLMATYVNFIKDRRTSFLNTGISSSIGSNQGTSEVYRAGRHLVTLLLFSVELGTC